MEALILAIIITYAIKKAVEDGKSHWQKSKTANRASSKGKSIPRRAASAVQHDTGYWAQQILSGFPRLRHGFSNGWHAGRTAQAESHAAREKAKADHLEKRAGLIPELREHRRRQDEALERIRAAEEPEPGFPVLLTARSKSGKPVNPVSGEPQDTIAVWGQDDLDRRRAAAAADPDMEVATRPMPNASRRCLHEGLDCPEGCQCVCQSCQIRRAPDDAARTLAAAAEGKRYVPAHEPDPHGIRRPVAAALAAAGVINHLPGRVQGALCGCATCRGETASPFSTPASTPTTEEGTGMATASDVTYDGVLRHVTMAQDFEEAALAERTGKATEASNISDQMQALGVDPATLGAMADYLDAMEEAQKAQQRAMEAAQAVATTLQRGHAGLAEAHKEAPVPAAQTPFYDEG